MIHKSSSDFVLATFGAAPVSISDKPMDKAEGL